MILTAWTILWLPFGAAVGIPLFLLNRPKAAGWTATAALGSSFILSLALLVRLGIPAEPVESSLPWILLPGVTVEFGILLNGLSLLMLLIVTGVGSLIFLYSQEYMAHDQGTPRYFACLSFFAFSMIGVVLANNFVEIFIFWELVGLSSYLLIGHWFEKPEASEAGKKAFLTTRVGDAGFLLGILLLFGWLQAGGEGTFNFRAVESLLEGIRENVGAGLPRPEGAETAPLQILTLAGLLIFLGVMGKSGQFPLHVWLPDAMEGPTPVSALIHAATMVAAGVFLLARLFFLFSLSPLVLAFVAVIGTFTAFFSASIALVQTDIKRILAYSTLSQLGYMVAALGLANPQAGIFHLGTHAFFKALLFLGAGSVIHQLHTQDIRQISGILRKMPVTGWTFLAGTLALVGIFPFAGFWSKEKILMTAYHQNFLIFSLLLLTVLFTAVYMGRLFAVAFLASPGGEKAESRKRGGDPSWLMKGPLVVLGIFSLLGGILPLKQFVPLEHEFHGPFLVTLLGLLAGTAGFLVTVYLYHFQPKRIREVAASLGPVEKILEKKYYVDEIYDALIRHVQDRLARLCDRFEQIVIVEFYVNGTARAARWAGDRFRKLQTGRIQFYVLLFSAGVTLLAYGMILWNR